MTGRTGNVVGMLRAAPTPGHRRSRGAAFAVAVTLGAMAVLGACAKSPSDPQLVDALTKSGIPKAEATCASKAIHASLTKAEIEQIVERGSGGAPQDDPKRTDDSLDKVRAALTVCRDTAAALTTTTSTEPVTVVVTNPTTPIGGGSAPAPGSNDASSTTSTTVAGG